MKKLVDSSRKQAIDKLNITHGTEDYNPEEVLKEFDDFTNEMLKEEEVGVQKALESGEIADSRDSILGKIREQQIETDKVNTKSNLNNYINNQTTILHTDPTQLGDIRKEINNAVEGASNLTPAERESLKTFGDKSVSTAFIEGTIRQAFETNAPFTDRNFKQSIKLKIVIEDELAETVLGEDFNKTFNTIYREAETDFSNRSANATAELINTMNANYKQVNVYDIREDIADNPYFTPTDKRKIIKEAEKIDAKMISANDFADKLNDPASYFDPSNDRESFINWLELGGLKTEQELPSVFEKTGFIPKPYMNRKMQLITNGSLTQAEETLTLFIRLEQANQQAFLGMLQENERTSYIRYRDKVKFGIEETPSEAIENLRAELKDPTFAKRKTVLENEFTKELVEKSSAMKDEILDYLKLDDISKRELAYGAIESSFLTAWKSFYADGMSMGDAKRAARDYIKGDWGRSPLSKDTMYLPPSVTNTPTMWNDDKEQYDHTWIKEDLYTFVENEGFEIEEGLVMLTDSITLKQHNTGELVSWVILAPNELSILVPLQKDGKFMRYIPVPSEVMLENQAFDVNKYINSPVQTAGDIP